MMSSSKDMSDLAFLVDIGGQLNDLNLKLQGKNKTIINTLPAVQVFSHKLELFLVDVQGDMLHFLTLKAFLDDDDDEMASCTAEYTHFIEKLQQEFSNRFSQFQSLKHIIQLIKAPQKAKPSGEWVTQFSQSTLKSANVSSLQLELCNLKSIDIDEIGFYLKASTKADLKASTKAEYPQLAQLGRWLYTVFAVTYICKSAFLYMNNIKSKLRSTLTQDLLCQLL
ncbi:general transcription factor II-I repeat domain-containing protein 2A-like [Watersipora subatra]|uniref:general transcription factor II-I repeat domain-containing protein 2A-like n=1 Tax=Watersipora subatra TaxID=2589382 RepID=UPI00355BC314